MKLLVTGAWKCTEEQLDTLRNLGNDVVFMQYEDNELPCPYEDVEGVICNGLFLYHPIFSKHIAALLPPKPEIIFKNEVP